MGRTTSYLHVMVGCGCGCDDDDSQFSTGPSHFSPTRCGIHVYMQAHAHATRLGACSGNHGGEVCVCEREERKEQTGSRQQAAGRHQISSPEPDRWTWCGAVIDDARPFRQRSIENSYEHNVTSPSTLMYCTALYCTMLLSTIYHCNGGKFPVDRCQVHISSRGRASSP